MKNIAAIGLLVLGLAQMAGDLANLAALKAIAAATGASPAPKVFSAVKGLEIFSTRFLVEWHDRTGKAHSLELTPKVCARLQGPYNRRTVYVIDRKGTVSYSDLRFGALDPKAYRDLKAAVQAAKRGR